MSTIVVVGGGSGGGGQNKVTVSQDGAVIDESNGATVAKFDNYADAIAYLQHLNEQGLSLG